MRFTEIGEYTNPGYVALCKFSDERPIFVLSRTFGTTARRVVGIFFGRDKPFATPDSLARERSRPPWITDDVKIPGAYIFFGGYKP